MDLDKIMQQPAQPSSIEKFKLKKHLPKENLDFQCRGQPNRPGTWPDHQKQEP